MCSRLAPGAMAAPALLHRFHLDVPLGAEHRLLEREVQPDEQVTAPLGTRSARRLAPPPKTAPEEDVEDVAHVPERKEARCLAPLGAEQVVLAPAGRVLQGL